jgi:hypothetical protein
MSGDASSHRLELTRFHVGATGRAEILGKPGGFSVCGNFEAARRVRHLFARRTNVTQLETALLCVTAIGGAFQADSPAATVQLREGIQIGTQVQTRMHLVIRGTIRSTGDKQENLRGQALLEYGERVLEMHPQGSAQRIVRYYQDARAKFVVGETEDGRQIRPAVRLLVGQREEQSLSLWSPAGPLTSDERELVEEVLDTTRLPLLLPGDAVRSGSTWKPEFDVLQSVLDLEHIAESNVAAKLAALDAAKATIVVTGTALGLSFGAEVKAKVNATLTYDRTAGLLEEVVWEQHDSRGPSPVSPPGEYEVKIAVTRKRTTTPQLSDRSLAGMDLKPNPASRLLVFEAPDRKYRFYFDRHWHLTTLQPELAVFRRMISSELIGQLNVTVLPDRKPGTRMSAAEFQKAVEDSGGWRIDQILRTDDLPTDGSFHLQMLSATGQQGELKLTQRHFLATSPLGRQVIFTFVAEAGNDEKLGNNDLTLVSTVEFPSQTAGVESPYRK